MSKRIAALALSLPVLLGSCAAYYSVRETLGYENRELLVERVIESKNRQLAAKEQFGSMLEAFQNLTRDDGTNLVPLYERLIQEVDETDSKAGSVESSLSSIQSVSTAVFKSWNDEIAELQSPELREEGAMALEATRESYLAFTTTMRDSLHAMNPIVRVFEDHVSFLSNGLSASAVSALVESSLGIEDDIADAMVSLDASMSATDDYQAALSN